MILSSSLPSVVATLNAILQHDNRYTLCGLWGEVLECETCPRVFHLGCTRPRLKDIPDGIWCCPYCKSLDKNLLEEEQQLAHASKNEIEACTGAITDNTSSKRPPPGQSANASLTEQESEKRPTLSNSTTEFVESVFGKEKWKRRNITVCAPYWSMCIRGFACAVSSGNQHTKSFHGTVELQLSNDQCQWPSKLQANISHGISLVSSRYEQWHPSEFRWQ